MTCQCGGLPGDDPRYCECGAPAAPRASENEPGAEEIHVSVDWSIGRAPTIPRPSYCAGVIDVAHWDSDDVHGKLHEALATAKANGIVGVVAKCTQGKDYVDPTWHAWVEACRDLGMLFGAYHFPSNTSSGEQQAEWFLEHVDAAGCDPATTLLMLDFERNPDPHLTMQLDEARAFAEHVHDARAVWPMLYGDVSFHSQIRDPHDALGACPLWPAMYGGSLAHGPKVPPAWATKSWTFWQYTDGTYCAAGLPRVTPGFGGIDRNVYRGTADQLRAAWPRMGG